MGLISEIWGRISMLLSSKAKQEFGVEAETSSGMEAFIEACSQIYRGNPEWVSKAKGIKTVNFAKTVCSEMATLTTLAINVKVSGSARADWIQKQIEKEYFNLRNWVEYGAAVGTVILKPNGKDIDVFCPGDFIITESHSKEIVGAIFKTQKHDVESNRWFTRLEYHRFLLNGNYAVSNRCFVSKKKDDTMKAVPIEDTPWGDLAEEVEIQGIDKPLFGVFKAPGANNVDFDSAFGMPVFSDAIEELRDLDVAYSRNSTEIFDSKRTVLMDSDRLVPMSSGRGEKRVTPSSGAYKEAAEKMELPDYVKIVDGNGEDDIYHEINPSLNTEQRLKGINALLSQIGYKCGFSNGYFVFNERTGMVTARQVESDDRRTIQTVKDMRDMLESCLNGLIYAINVFADLYDLAPLGTYEIVYDFGDITYNREEDRARWLSYVSLNMIPKWYYLMKFEGIPEEDAKELNAEAEPQAPVPFADEE